MNRILYLLISLLIGFTGGAFVNQVWSPKIYQPINFNHYIHAKENELECTFCHKGVRRKSKATFPSISVCIECHEEALTKSPEEEKIREYYKKGMEIPWQKILRMPEHVYFSHYTHTAIGNIECVECHGKIYELKLPPDKPLKRMRMKDCINCHRKNKVTEDCNACHK